MEAELEALGRAEAEADRKEHAAEGKRQADELARVFRALDHAVKNMMMTLRDARALVDQNRQRGYFGVTLQRNELRSGCAPQ